MAPHVHFNIHDNSGAALAGSQVPMLQQGTGTEEEDPFVVPSSSTQVSIFSTDL